VVDNRMERWTPAIPHWFPVNWYFKAWRPIFWTFVWLFLMTAVAVGVKLGSL
jgi:hypothetical protein